MIKRVLLIDGSDVNGPLRQALLQLCGYDVVLSETDARMASESAFDLVLIDAGSTPCAKESPFAVVQRFYPGVRIMALADAELAEIRLSTGVDRILPPFASPKDIIDAIGELSVRV